MRLPRHVLRRFEHGREREEYCEQGLSSTETGLQSFFLSVWLVENHSGKILKIVERPNVDNDASSNAELK